MSNTAHPRYRTAHGEFRPGDVVWHVGPSGDRTRPGTIRDTGPAFGVVFHDAAGVHLVPAGEVRHPGSKLPVRASDPFAVPRQQYVVFRMFDGEPLPDAYPKIYRAREDAVEEAGQRSAQDGSTIYAVFVMTDVLIPQPSGFAAHLAYPDVL